MAWIMRILVALALGLGLVIIFVALIGNIRTRDQGTEAVALTVGGRTVTVAGHYKNLSQESVAGGVKIIVEGHEVMLTGDQLSVDGKAEVLEPEENVMVFVAKDGTTQVKVAPAKEPGEG